MTQPVALSKRRVALAVAGSVGVLAGTLMAFAPAASAAGTQYAVSEVPVTGIAETVAADPATNTIYAVTGGPSGVDVIDGATNTVTAQIALPFAPNLIAVDPASDTVYAIDSTTWAVINGATNAVTTTLSIQTGSDTDVAVNPVTHMIYVPDETAGTVIVVDGSTDTVAATISLADPSLDISPLPRNVAVDATTNTVYVSDFGELASGVRQGQVDVIDGATNAVTSRIVVGGLPGAVAANPAAGLVYVLNEGSSDSASGSVSVIDATTGDVSALAASGMAFPADLALDPGTGTLYATSPGSANALGTTWAIDTASGAIVAEIPRGGSTVIVGPASGGSAYIDGDARIGGFVGGSASDVTVITPSSVSTMSPVVITTEDDIIARPGIVVSDQLTASASPAATFSATGLPAWLSILPSGLLEGTPTAIGTFTVTVTAANGIAPPSTVVLTFTVGSLPQITSADQVTFSTGVTGTFTVTATGSPAPLLFVSAGVLPAGVSFSTAGVLTGMPAAGTGGVYPIQLTATNAEGSDTQAFSLTVNEPVAAGAPLPAGGVLGDLNGDGLADILAFDPSGNLWMYANTGSGGQEMFGGARSLVGAGWTGYRLGAVADLYGSGRAGILAIDPSGNLWYYPNIGGSGTSTFGARSRVGFGWGGYTIVGLTGLHGPSRPGILAIDPSGRLWYYPNVGGSGTSTFGARSLVGVGWTGYTADVADITGDGTPDLLAVDTSGNMWLYPNTGGTGLSTFGAPTQVSGGWSGYQAVDAGQLTNVGPLSHGPASIIGVDPAGNLWYYHNTGATGASTFGTPLQVGGGWTGYTIN